MSIERNLRDALNAIEGALRKLKRVKNTHPDDGNVKRAIRELKEAQDDIERAKRSLN